MNQPLERIGSFQYQRFSPTLPVPRGAGEPESHDVVIVGGGPVGLLVALGLARQGVRCVVIEADDSVCEGSRAACVSRRSLQILERSGAVEDFMAKGLPWTTGRSFYREQEVLRFSMPHDAGQKYPPMINLQQYYIEQYLHDAIDRYNAATPGIIDIRWASKLSRIESGASRVSLQVDNALGSYRCQAEWVVACDGGQSFVRDALGLELAGTAYEGRYVIIDIELQSSAPTERRAWFDPPWWRGSTILMHRQPDNIWRIDYQVRPGEDPQAALSPERVHEFVQRHLDAIGEGHLPWQPVWTSIYRAGAMTLDSYRHGRVLFAGNAAHAMPIFGVRGLNSGIDDADNLAWKLAYVVKGDASEALLDSYSSERIGAFHINATNAMRSTEFMSPPSRGFDLMREAALSLASAHPEIARLINPRQTNALSYGDSPLSSASDPFECGPAPGAPLVEVQTEENGTYMTSVLDATRFTLFVFDAVGTFTRALGDELYHSFSLLHLLRVSSKDTEDSAFATLIDRHGRIGDAYGARDGSMYLVRPDGHVAARWHRPRPSVILDALSKACSTQNKLLSELEQ